MSTNVPVTVWNPPYYGGEYTPGTVSDIVDASGVFLVDPQSSSTLIVDTGVDFTPVPATTWISDDSL